MEQVCEILWEKNENDKNMTLIMCIEEPMIYEINNTVFFNRLNGNLSKSSKNSSLENKTIEIQLKNNTYNMQLNNTLEELRNETFKNETISSPVFESAIPSPSSSAIPSPSAMPSPSVIPSPSYTPSPFVIHSPSYTPSPFHDKEQIEIAINDLNIINPSSSNISESYYKNNSIIEINSDNTSLLILSISGSLVLIFIIAYILNKYRKNQSVAPCPPVVANNKRKYVRKSSNNNKPKDYILEILPGTPRSALFNRVPVAKRHHQLEDPGVYLENQ